MRTPPRVDLRDPVVLAFSQATAHLIAAQGVDAPFRELADVASAVRGALLPLMLMGESADDGAPVKSKPAAPPKSKPVAPPKSKPAAPPQSKRAAPPKSKPVAATRATPAAATGTKAPWAFPEPPGTLVFTSLAVTEGGAWIHYVLHDADDGAWQLLPQGGISSEEDAVLVPLSAMVKRDATLAALSDLPRGSCAWRDEQGAPWQRAEL